MGDDTDRTLFLHDGLAARPAPVMLLVTDRELAAEFARRVHSEDGRGPAFRPPGTVCSPSTRRHPDRRGVRRDPVRHR
jgi:hypothetical protein